MHQFSKIKYESDFFRIRTYLQQYWADAAALRTCHHHTNIIM